LLDAYFIFVLKTGVEGAALATIMSQVISTVVCVNKLRKIELIAIERKHFRNDRSVYIALFRNGIPMALMNSITAIGCMVVQHYINGYGVDYTTAYSACCKYLNLFMNPAATAGNAMSAYTSQNYGAKRFDRISQGLRVCLSISFVTYVLLGSLMVLIPEQLTRILISGDEPVRLACSFLPICGMAIIIVDCLFVVRNGVQGMGDPVLPMWSGVLEMVLRILAISLLIGRIGFKAAAIAEICAWTGALLVNAYAFGRILLPKLSKISVKPNSRIV
jgi:Na+-driven multidrug efflux pump